MKVIVATGRHYLNAIKILKKSGFVPEYIICDNGCSVYSVKDDKQLFSFPLHKEIVSEVLDVLEESNYFYSISTDKFRISKPDSLQTLKSEFVRNKEAIPDLDPYHLDSLVTIIESNKDLVYSDATTIKEICELDVNFYNISAITFDPERIKFGQEVLSKIKGISVVSSAYNNFEAINSDCSKGNAIKLLTTHLNIDMKDTMAIGDNFNDVSMFEVVEHSVAMGNSHEDIKKMCKYVSVANTENGVSYALKNFL